MNGDSVPPADITVDGSGLLCVTLLLRMRAQITDAEPGTVVHVIATDPAAPLDLPAWCHMTGHHYLGSVQEDGDRAVYALRLVDGVRPIRRPTPIPCSTTQSGGGGRGWRAASSARRCSSTSSVPTSKRIVSCWSARSA
ncbi:sulfurtransferase TusA family protein [Streptomyces sp. NPDC059744]|uniref:sulfurtransferase TusA family protein n=1 Tax=Streptomyces sp. NPDC059744 TaxID=3346929 RepID=UPI0036487E7A